MPLTRARRRMPAAAALVALALVAAACHSGGTTFKAGENDVNPMPADKLQDGGTLNWPIGALPINYNFNQSGANTVDELAIISAVMPTLFTFDASGTPSVNSAYLTSASVTGQSPQVVTYEINPKAAWNDGTPITEADFAAQWQALNGSNTAFRAAAPAGYAGIQSVAQGKGPKEAVVTFKQPFADWRSLFSPLFPASLNGDPSAFNSGWVTGTATSAGPFVFEGADTIAKTVTLVRDPKWWGGTPRIFSIIYRAVGSDVGAQLDALGKGKVDFVGLAPDQAQLARAKAMNGMVIRRAAGPAFRQLTFNGTSPALSDPTLRRAVAMAIDRAAIAKAVLDPLGVSPKTLDNHIYMTNQAGYQADAGDFTSANATRAGDLLDQDGWKLSGSSSGGVRTRNGQPLSLRLVIPDNSAEAPQESSLLKSQLQAVGITLLVQSVPGQQFFDNFVTRGDFDLALFSWQGTLFPISAALPIYVSPTVTSSGVDVHQNYARIGSGDIDQLFAKATAELDPATATRLGNQIDGAIWKEVHSLTLYQLPQLFAERATIANFGAFGFASVNYQMIGFAGS